MTSVPEWTRCHGITVPDEDVLFQAAGGTVEIWRQIFERVSQMRVRQLHFDHYFFYLISFRPKGFESLGRLSNCLLRDFFILPVVFLLLGLMQLKNKMSASGFTLVGALPAHPSPQTAETVELDYSPSIHSAAGIIAVTIFEDETSFAHALKPRSRWQRFNSVSAKYGMCAAARPHPWRAV